MHMLGVGKKEKLEERNDVEHDHNVQKKTLGYPCLPGQRQCPRFATVLPPLPAHQTESLLAPLLTGEQRRDRQRPFHSDEVPRTG